jgi:hypothetical protein
MEEQILFSESDAWIFISFCETVNNNEFDYETMIVIADFYQHAIPNYDEVKSFFEKGMKYSLISFKDNFFSLSNKGKEIYEKYKKVKGGAFSRTEIAYKKLNSYRNKFEENLNIPEFCFISEKDYLALCKHYSNTFGLK